jgi:hypothetical protein
VSLTRTSLSAAITASQLQQIGITSTASGFPTAGVLGSRQIMQIDGEKMLIDQVVASGVVNVLMRGYDGTVAAAHDILAPVITSSVATVGQNGAIAIPTKNTTFLLTKATALASTTLAAPGKDQDGLRLTFTNQTNAAHVITATSLLADGVTGAPHTTATFGAFIGASLTLVADNGLWNVVAQVVCVIT